MSQCRSPSMQNAGHANPRAETFGISGNGRDRLRRCFKQQAIDGLLIPISDASNLGWQGEHNVEIFHRQQIVGARGHPVSRGGSLTLRAMPVLAGIVRNMLVVALGARGHMPAECLGSAGFN